MKNTLDDDMAAILTEEIDWCIVTDILVESGWTEIIVPSTTPDNYIKMQEWAKVTLHNDYQGRDNRWAFVDPSEAAMFAMRWYDNSSK